jgi:hypothetical protein
MRRGVGQFRRSPTLARKCWRNLSSKRTGEADVVFMVEREQATGSPAQIGGSDMSETAPGASTTTSSGGLYDETGSPIRSQTEQKLEPLVSFVKEQPVAAALGALVIGYILGKIF